MTSQTRAKPVLHGRGLAALAYLLEGRLAYHLRGRLACPLRNRLACLPKGRLAYLLNGSGVPSRRL